MIVGFFGFCINGFYVIGLEFFYRGNMGNILVFEVLF